jgi:hypothetical protein
MTRIAVPALIIMLAVALFVGAAAWNQSGDPRLVITLTERELPLVPSRGGSDDDPGVRLRIAAATRHEPLDARNWLPESRLREIGFPFNVPVGSPRAVDAYDHVPARIAWVVFEYEGPAWRDIERRSRLRDEQHVPVALMASRLVPIDAGADFDVLRTRYPSGHLIIRAEIGLAFLPSQHGGPLLYGTLRRLVPHAVAVPYRLRPVLESLTLPTGVATEPRYEAELAIGSLGHPYVRSLRLRQ